MLFQHTLLYCYCCIIITTNTLIYAKLGIGDTEQDWGYIDVRPNAHMFWWLYYTTANVSNYTDRPLILWLQGGPGMPSSGYGNFGELGPLDINLKTRPNTVVDNFNILFIDNPVGSGYSYLTNDTKLAGNGEEVAEDIYKFLKRFYGTKPEFREVPLYVFGESYGGKMATNFIYHLIKKKEKFCNLKGLGLGDAYISPLDYIAQYAPMALHLGLTDKQGFTRIDESTKQIQILINQNKYETAADMESVITDQLHMEMNGIVDLYNFISETNETKPPKLYDFLKPLRQLMNHQVKQKLGIFDNITWEYYNSEVPVALKGDLMISVTEKLEYLLNTTNIKIIVYNGILDFLVNTSGTLAWLDKLKWHGQERWLNETQSPFEINRIYEGYFKRADNLVFYAILRAGHSVPVDNLAAMNAILERELLD